MTFVVTDNCIKCTYIDCVEVCPVDCFYEGENMLVIHPDECIDCGVCEPECRGTTFDLLFRSVEADGPVALPPLNADLGYGSVLQR